MDNRLFFRFGPDGEEVLLEGSNVNLDRTLVPSPTTNKTYLGVHPGCDGHVDLVNVTPVSQAMCCSGCLLRVIVPNSHTRTVGKLKAYFDQRYPRSDS